jgi:hypothetical protein
MQLLLYFYVHLIFSRYKFGLECNILNSSSPSSASSCLPGKKSVLQIHLFLLKVNKINPLNAKLNPICPLLALFGAHHILHVSR